MTTGVRSQGAALICGAHWRDKDGGHTSLHPELLGSRRNQVFSKPKSLSDRNRGAGAGPGGL